MLRRPAFTIVEVLVVIAIIGVLAGLLLPAIQNAREAGRRLTCSTNLRQIGVALQLHHDFLNEFPYGRYRVYEVKPGYSEYKGTMKTYILPYLEQGNLASRMQSDTNWPNNVPGIRIDGRRLETFPIPTYVCPSDPYGMASKTKSQTVGGVSFPHQVANYVASGGGAWMPNPGAAACACTHSWTSTYFHGSQGFYRKGLYQDPPSRLLRTGPFVNRDDNRHGHSLPSSQIAHIRDGLSNTIFCGEILIGHNIKRVSGWASLTENGDAGTTVTIPLNYRTSLTQADVDAAGNDGFIGCLANCNENTASGFKSAHPGGVTFLLGDGSVHFVNDAIDHWTLQRLGAVADGEPVGAY
jgi:prepilin-type N-terminal cleavage/methylation domain-containing protein